MSDVKRIRVEKETGEKETGDLSSKNEENKRTSQISQIPPFIGLSDSETTNLVNRIKAAEAAEKKRVDEMIASMVPNQTGGTDDAFFLKFYRSLIENDYWRDFSDYQRGDVTDIFIKLWSDVNNNHVDDT